MPLVTDYFADTYNAGNPNVARVTAPRSAAGSSLTCDNLAGWPTGTPVQFSTYKINTSNAVVPGTQIDWTGIVSGNSIGTLTYVTGATDAGSAIGDVVECNPTAYWAHQLVTGIAVGHKPTGTHKSDLSLTTPKITTGIKDANGNTEIGFTATGSAVNQFTIANAATGSAPTLSATGGDTNIDIRLVPKGTGNIKRGSTGGSIDWWEELGRTT